MESIVYSFHLGSDKNKTIKAKQISQTNVSKTTSYNNNAIQNIKDLGKINHHNLRKYDNHQELIKIIKGTNDIIKDVKNIYFNEFENARLEYNLRQTRSNRKINDYFLSISKDEKHDLACEIIIELGNMNFWKDKPMNERYKMVDVFIEQINDLEKSMPQFKIANATIHFDEMSPHLHIIGVPIKENCKTGLKKQVGKTSVFTKDTLTLLQKEMREYAIDSFNKYFTEKAELKEKQQGRNYDFKVKEMAHYNKMMKTYNLHQEQLKEIKQRNLQLQEKIINTKKELETIKLLPLNKTNYLLPAPKKQMLLALMEETKNYSTEVKNLVDFSFSIKQVKNDLTENKSVIEKQEKTIAMQNQKIYQLEKNCIQKDNIIEELNNENYFLKGKVNNLEKIISYLKERLNKLIKYIYKKAKSISAENKAYSQVFQELQEEQLINKEDLIDFKTERKKEKEFEL